MKAQQVLFGGGAEQPTAAGQVVVQGDTVTATSPEGAQKSMKLADLLERARPRTMDTVEAVLPDGVKCALPIPGGTVLVKEIRPRAQPVRWIAADSPAPFGPATRYRDVSIALPYIIIVAVFEARPGRSPHLGRSSECFFSNRSLDRDGLATKLCYPALLNCSRFPDSAQHPLSWICIEHLARKELTEAKSPSEAYHSGLTALLEHLFGAGFNLSSEHHELSSWFTETVKAKVDPRVSSIEAWEQATRENKLFALEVPWLATGRSLREVVQRIADARETRAPHVETARDLTRLLFQRGGKR